MLSLHSFTKLNSKYINIDKKISLTHRTIFYLKQFFNLLKDNNNQDHSYTLKKVDNILLKPTHFISINTINLVKRNSNYLYESTFIVNRIKIVLQMYCDKDEKINIQYMKLIFSWIHIITKFVKPNCIRELHIDIYFSNLTKKITNKNLTVDNINSGYTTGGCSEVNKIVIFRKEEWFKVLIHELFHNMGLDFACMNHTDADKLIFNLIKLKKNDIRLYESYTECWANILNTVFLAFFDTKIKKNYDIMLTKIEKMTQNEICFALFQLKKVLNHYNLKYNEIYKANNNYKENTHVISYYMIKLIFLYNKNKFIEWNHSHNSYIQFTQTQENIIELCKFIYSLYDQSCFIEDIEEFSKKTSNNQLINKSMRMTLYEMEN